jgi:four helix bundle protein
LANYLIDRRVGYAGEERNIILEKTFEFALLIIKYAELLEKQRKYQVANQVLKSGTSIGANVREAQNAKSKADFIHKMKIAAKEADETEYWLLLCKESKNYPFDESLLEELKHIIFVLSKIIGTSKRNQ